jgi:hypothetical protein
MRKNRMSGAHIGHPETVMSQLAHLPQHRSTTL